MQQAKTQTLNMIQRLSDVLEDENKENIDPHANKITKADHQMPL